MQAAISGAAQIGMSSRALTPDEASHVTAIAVARDGIAISGEATIRVEAIDQSEVVLVDSA